VKKIRRLRGGVAPVPEPQWIEIYGGGTGSTWVGDILVAFELCKKKEAARLPLRSIEPSRKPCTLQIAVHSIRDLHPYDTATEEGVQVRSVASKSYDRGGPGGSMEP